MIDENAAAEAEAETGAEAEAPAVESEQAAAAATDALFDPAPAAEPAIEPAPAVEAADGGVNHSPDTILPPEPTLEHVWPEPAPAVTAAANAAYEEMMERSKADHVEEPSEETFIDGDTLVPMSHPDGGSCDAYETDAAGRLMVPAIEVPSMLSHGFVVAGSAE